MKRIHLLILCALFISVSSGICQRSQPPEKPVIANYKPDILAEMGAHTKLSNSILSDGDDDWNREDGDPLANGVMPRSSCKYNGIQNVTPRQLAMENRLTTLHWPNIRFESSPRSSIGLGWRRPTHVRTIARPPTGTRGGSPTG